MNDDITRATPAQLAVLRELARNKNTRQVAAEFGISRNVVKNHLFDARKRINPEGISPEEGITTYRMIALYVHEYGLPTRRQGHATQERA